MADPKDWMWSDALEMLGRAERMHRQFFRPATSGAQPCWEPPIDLFETQREILILTALPGVAPDDVSVAIEDGAVVITGTRSYPRELQSAKIHRLELPQGCFVRRIALPAGRYDRVQRSHVNGCLVISLRKLGAP